MRKKKMILYINYHINPEAVSVETIKGEGGRRDSYKIGDTSIHLDAGQPVLSIQDGRWKHPPADLIDHVQRVSIMSDGCEYNLDRVAGKYRLGDAKAVVDLTNRTHDDRIGVIIQVTAPAKESALELWDTIYRGDIRPYDEMNQAQIPPLIDNDTMQEVRQQAAELARKFLKEEMAKLAAA